MSDFLPMQTCKKCGFVTISLDQSPILECADCGATALQCRHPIGVYWPDRGGIICAVCRANVISDTIPVVPVRPIRFAKGGK